MVANAATARVVNRIGEQVIEIDQHGGHHHQPGAEPDSSKGKRRHQARDRKMQKQMRERPNIK